MFICMLCADRVYGGIKNPRKSFGTCDECGKIDNCYNIRLDSLPPKNPVPIGPQFNKTAIQELKGMNRNDSIIRGHSKNEQRS